MISDLKINGRFKQLCPPLTEAEYEQLEKNIVEAGAVRDRIIVWNAAIIDGHNRFEIASKHGLPYDVLEMEFDSEDDACEWIATNQLGRRNLNAKWTSYLIGKKYLSAKKKRGGERNGSGRKASSQTVDTNGHKSKGQIVPLINLDESKSTKKSTAQEVAEEAGTSDRTVKRSAVVTKCLDLLQDGIRERYLDNKLKIPQHALTEFAKLDHTTQLEIDRDVRVGNHDSIVDALSARGVNLSKKNGKPKSNGKKAAKTEVDLGKCPNCAGTKWGEDEDGVHCARCLHPHGEPAGDTDKDRLKAQRSRTVKTVEATLRAFDDLHLMSSKEPEHTQAVSYCKWLLKAAKEWK